MDDDKISKILSDPRVPWASLYRAGGNSAVVVEDLVGFARREYGESGEIERLFDAYVISVGGRRTTMVDPYAFIKRLVTRRHEPSGDVYELPAEWAHSKGIDPQDLQCSSGWRKEGPSSE